MIRMLAIISATCVSAVTVAAAAQERFPPPARALVPLGALDLSAQQRQEIRQAQRDYHIRYCDITGRMLDAQYEIRELYARERRDPKQAGQAFRSLAVLQQQLTEARIAAENRAEAVLTEAQREKWRAWRQGNLPDVYTDELPYTMQPGIQDDTVAPDNQDEPRQYPVPPRH